MQGRRTVDVMVEIGPERPAPGDALCVKYAGREGTLRFQVDPAGERVWADWVGVQRAGSFDTLAGMLLGPVLGWVLRLRGRVSLHACVAEVGSRAIAVLGHRGTGKSTLAAALAGRGHAVLSDDVGAIAYDPARGWVAHPGYPRLRLPTSAIEALGATDWDLGPVFSGRDKRYVELTEGEPTGPWRFQAVARPLGAIYVLARGPGGFAPVIESIAGTARLGALARYTKRALAPLDPAVRSRELERLSRLAAAVPMRRVAYPTGLDELPAVCAAIADDAILGVAA
jgi:hypothetical protein